MLVAPDLPEPGEQSLDDRRRIGRRFIIHAREVLEKGYWLKARTLTCASNTQLRRLRSLTGDDSLRLGDTSAVGFPLKHDATDK